ncbi:FkbM family methyltransferase [Mucisphaera sp.]|uniref:FkbM family methyltransferase n=1 Tax=Mucisphaera sp. TaxID=2913024 RepID=UPI003D15116B
MAGWYLPLIRGVRSSKTLKSIARSARFAMPDIKVTAKVDYLGKFQFRVKRHHWLWGRRALDGHARNLAMFDRIIQPDAVFYDVGLNIGYYARFIASHLPVRRLVGFEPMTQNLDLARRNLELCPKPGVIGLHEIALGDTDGEELLQVDDITDGSAVLDRISGGQPADGRRIAGLPGMTESVRMMRLDHFVEEGSEPPPTAMKIDTEGAEVIVLKGATRTLEKHSPHLVIATHGIEPANGCFELLDPLGYHLYGWVRHQDAEGEHYQRLHPNDLTRLGDNNILASRDSDLLTPEIQPLNMSRLSLNG